MLQKAIIFGHADGDGHLAAIQSSENLAKRNIEISEVVVDSQITHSWKFWENQFQQYNFGQADIIVVVDIMLNAKNPYQSYEALVSRVVSEPDRQFIIIDHHAVDNLPNAPRNLEIKFVQSVYKCCYGKPSDLMLIASICDNDEEPVRQYLTEVHRRRALGITRAISDREGLAGKPTLNLINARAWKVFEQLADEPAAYHRTYYGNRINKKPESPLLQVAHAVRSSI